MNRIFFLLIASYLLLLGACIDPVNLTLESEGEFLVVDGTFTPIKKTHTLKLYYATSQRIVPQRQVTNAQIILVENEEKRVPYLEVQPGNYQLAGDQLVGTIGKNYHIEIVLDNGETYHSRQETMPNLIKGDSVFFNFIYKQEPNTTSIVTRPYIEIFIATSLPQGDKDYWLKWDIRTLYSFPEVICSPIGPPPETCYITGTLNAQQVSLLNGTTVQSSYLSKWKVGEKQLIGSDEEFRGKYYFLVNQQSITENAHNYWSKINLVSNQSGSIFDAPPASIPGNLYNINDPEEIVLGYFELAAIDSLRASLTEGDFYDFYKFTSNVCPSPSRPFASFNRACCRCEILENSSFNRPLWF